MVRNKLLWVLVISIGTTLAQPIAQSDGENPLGASYNTEEYAGNRVVEIGPCNPDENAVNYIYGQAPQGRVIIKPGQVRFSRPVPIIVRPGQIRFPPQPAIYVKPADVQPPTPDPITIRPPVVQPPLPRPFYVRVPPVKLPTPNPIYIRPQPVIVPRPPPITVQPPPVPVPTSGSLIIQPSKITIPSPPTICFQPNPPNVFKLLGLPVITRQTRESCDFPEPGFRTDLCSETDVSPCIIPEPYPMPDPCLLPRPMPDPCLPPRPMPEPSLQPLPIPEPCSEPDLFDYFQHY